MSQADEAASLAAGASAATTEPSVVPGQLNPQMDESAESVSAPSVDDVSNQIQI